MTTETQYSRCTRHRSIPPINKADIWRDVGCLIRLTMYPCNIQRGGCILAKMTPWL